MKKLVIALMLCLPMMALAQTVLTPEEQLEQAQKQLKEAQKAVEQAKAKAAEAAQAKARAEAQAKAKADAAAKQKAEAQAKAKAEEIQKKIAATKAKAARLNAEAEKLQREMAPTQSSAGWSIPESASKTTSSPAANRNKGAQEVNPNVRYLDGAVSTTADGKVMFTLDTEAAGKSAGQIYDIVYDYLNRLTTADGQLEGSRVALVNKAEGIIAATVKEWLVFQNSFLSLDRSKFDYILVAKCTDNHLQLTMERMVYTYEENRPTGFKAPAEEVITDRYALNKKKTELARIYGKFRRATIDRRNEIFNDIARLIHQ